jgi:pimeloyl-ACP methyl ester carboxylesterase
LLPLLTDVTRTDAISTRSLRSMMNMTFGTPPIAAPPASARASPFKLLDSLRLPSLQLKVHAPSQAVDFRLRLLQSGGLSDAQLAAIQVPTLVIASAKDRLFPSLQEGKV